MLCSVPPPLTHDQLSAALDGDADQVVRDHLDRCPSCRARLEQAGLAERALAGRLRRWDCPSPKQLGEYDLGLLDPDEMGAIGRHLDQCARCSAEIEQLRLFLAAGDQPAPQALQPRHLPRPRLAELVARWLPPIPTPALAVRGAGPAPLVADANGLTIFLQPQPIDDRRLNLTGQVVADDQERWAGALVELRIAGVLQAAVALDVLGGWSCGPLPAGAAELRVTREDGAVVVLPEFELSAHG
jgi:hypothetical protein